MTRNYCTPSNYNVAKSAFSGIIYKGDYDNYHSMSDIAERIASDLRFDEKCRKNEEIRNRKHKEK